MAYKTLLCWMFLALLAGSALAQAPGAAPTAPPTKSPSPAPDAPTSPSPTPAPAVPAPTPATVPSTSPSSSPASSPPSPVVPVPSSIATPPSDAASPSSHRNTAGLNRATVACALIGVAGLVVPHVATDAQPHVHAVGIDQLQQHWLVLSRLYQLAVLFSFGVVSRHTGGWFG
ncbi:hypothetical protein SADUNF_Sadunf05G0114900 [Salix dunnii]|uniref:Arabinogalactan-like protein n=1 Tax=Salix dunnii TaxID=1413687 RepID=A0A835KAU1_9ROSI|nr:hypothetical protein SADUNF_Sadunf05G0114900 [Salix dunnii]